MGCGTRSEGDDVAAEEDDMKRFAWMVVAVSTLLVSSAAMAQDDEGEEEIGTRFYDFNDMLIDGEFLKPEGMFATERGRARFDSLLSLRRSFLEEIQSDAHGDALE